MTHGVLVVGLSLGGALFFAASTSLKHRSAHSVPRTDAMSMSAVGKMVGATVRHPLWVLGMLLDAVGVLCQVCALHLGALAIVQPLMLTELVFALVLPIGHRRGRLTSSEITWAALVCVCLGVLLTVTRMPTSHRSSVSPDRLPVTLGAIAGTACILIAAIVGQRKRHDVIGAAILGAAVGAIYAASAGLLKATSDVAVRSIPAVLESWQLYALVMAGAAGLFFSQVAFQAGPLTASLPAIATVDPLLSIAIGVAFFDEHISAGAGRGVLLPALLIVLGVSVVRLTRIGARDGSLAVEQRGAVGQ